MLAFQSGSTGKTLIATLCGRMDKWETEIIDADDEKQADEKKKIDANIFIQIEIVCDAVT